jgi:hypothetical protein
MAYRADLVTADAFTVVPSDTTKVTAFGFYVGSVAGGANVTVVTADGTTTLFAGLTVGTIIHQAISQFKLTGTTASNLVAFGPQ